MINTLVSSPKKVVIYEAIEETTMREKLILEANEGLKCAIGNIKRHSNHDNFSIGLDGYYPNSY